jgi:hypothetical protein
MMKKIYVDTFQVRTKYRGTAVSDLVERSIRELTLRRDIHPVCVGDRTENRHWHMLIRFFLSLKYDVLVLSNPNTLIPPWGGYVTFLDVIPYERAKGIKKIFFHIQYILWLMSAKKVYTFSHEIKEKLEDILGRPCKKITVVPFSLSDKYVDLVEKPKQFVKKDYVLGFGTGEPRKNLPRTLAMFSEIYSLNPNMELYLFGNNWSNVGYQFVEEELEKYHLRRRVKHFHKVSIDELIRLYAEAQLFLFPSFSEGIGMPPFEAVASGTKVILSDIKIFKELFADYKNVFFVTLDNPCGDKSVLARALESSFNNEDYLQIKKHKLKYSIDIMSEDMLS